MFGHKSLHFISHNYLCCCPESWWVSVLGVDWCQDSRTHLQRCWGSGVLKSHFSSLPLFHCYLFFFLSLIAHCISTFPLLTGRAIVNLGHSWSRGSKCMLEGRSVCVGGCLLDWWINEAWPWLCGVCRCLNGGYVCLCMRILRGGSPPLPVIVFTCWCSVYLSVNMLTRVVAVLIVSSLDCEMVPLTFVCYFIETWFTFSCKTLNIENTLPTTNI